MRILLVTPLFFPSLSVAAVYFDTLGKELARLLPAGRVTILTRRVPGAPRAERRGAVRVLRLLPTGGRPAAVLTGLGILAASLALRAHVVHYHTLASYRVLARLAPLFRARLVGDMRDLAARDEGASLASYQHCSRLICASENILAFLRDRGFPADRLVHVPVPVRRPPPAPDGAVAEARARWGLRDVPFVLFVGAIRPAKGVRELLEAMPLVWARRPDLHLAMAGPLTPEGDALFAGGLAAHAGRDGRLRYLGPVPHDDVLLLLRAAEAFVLPSRSEGLPRSALEALALGVPAVLPPGIPEFDRACPEAVLEAITPEAIARKLGTARGRARYPMAQHDPAEVARRTLAVYRAALG